MSRASSLSDSDLLTRLTLLARAERDAMADVITHLIELDRRRLFLDQACSSLYKYCTERLGYSEDAALKRVRVARLAERLPQVLEELRSGAIHLTGLFLLSQHLTDENVDALLPEARGKSRRELERLIARWFPRPDVPERIAPAQVGTATTPTASQPSPSGSESGAQSTCPEPGNSAGQFRLEPLSITSYRVEFTASAELRDKIERARELMSHSIPNGELSAVFERALDALIRTETKRRMGAQKPGKQRPIRPGSRHIPVAVARIVWERDGGQCTFRDAQGKRCTERCFLTIEHREPFALGGPSDGDNLCLLCAAHNQHRARQVFGERGAGPRKRGDRETDELGERQKVLFALCNLGFRRREAARAVEAAATASNVGGVEPLLRAALDFLSA